MTTQATKSITNLTASEKKAFLEQRLKRKTKADITIPQRTQAGPAPLSYGQEGVWYLEQLQPGTTTFNMHSAWRIKGVIDISALKQSLNKIIQRHGSLRTSFRIIDEQPVQEIASDVSLPFRVIDLQHLSNVERENEVKILLKKERHRPFDLTQVPLLRASLLQLNPNECIFMLTIHHIVSDGWSRGILQRELSTYYASFSTQQSEPALPELPIQYADFAAWQREQLHGEVLEGHLAYWREHLEGAPALLELPTDFTRPASQSYKGDHVEAKLPDSLARQLTNLSNAENATLFMTLLTAFKILLQRYTGQADIVVGTPMVNRSHIEVENLIGYFLNNLALRTNLSGDVTFRELLGRVRETTLGAYSNQGLPFERLVQELQPHRDLSYTPIFQIFFNMFFDEGQFELANLETNSITQDEIEVGSKFDLTMYVRKSANEIYFSLVYKTALFRRDRMVEALDQYIQLLQHIVENPDSCISEFSLATPHANRVLPDPTASLSDHWVGAVHTQFSKLARRYPTQTAITDSHSNWTYQELEARSNQLAHYLIANNIQPGTVVAIYGHRSASLVWAWLGILKAGAAFVNLDPAYPADRLIEYLDISKPKGLIQIEAAGSLTEELTQYADRLSCRITLPHLSQAANNDLLVQYPSTLPGINIGSDDTAYIAFTSGSTGKPKGVRGRHGPLSHFLPWQADVFNLSRIDRFSMLSGLSHDPLQRDIFTALWVGATICIPDPEMIGSQGYLAEWMQKEKITFAHMTPPMSQILTETAPANHILPQLRYAFYVGDKLTRQHVTDLQKLAPHAMCINSYGSTETQRAVGYHWLRPDSMDNSKPIYPLGKGMPDVQLLVLNKIHQLAGIGEIGEIYVRSPHLAGGYIGDDGLTKIKFITNPFTNIEGDWLYRTGDLGRYQPDGIVEFAGRADRQIKIRGFRIEPGEIEYALAQHPLIRQAVVMARDDVSGGYGLVAYLVVNEHTNNISIEDIRAFLKERFPNYMIPTAYVKIHALPITPNGKINYRDLPPPPVSNVKPEGNFTLPRNELERQLVQIWVQLLGHEAISVHDNFFELGGHSLLAIRLFTQLERELGKKLPLTTLFHAPTIAQLARFIYEETIEVDESTLVTIQPGNSNPPFFCIHGFGGGVVGYGELARLLGPEQPFYGLQAKGIDGVGEFDTEVEVMADRYIQAMRAVQPEGPYYLGGYCYGGVIAFEMARHLETQGETPALVAIFEGYAPLRGGNRDSIWRNPQLLLNFMHNMPYWFFDYLQLGYKQMWRRLRRKFRSHWKKVMRKFGVIVMYGAEDVIDDTAHLPAKQRQLMETQLRAMSKYDPEIYNGSVTLFRVRSQSLSRTPDPAMGWNKVVARGVNIRRIAGNHHNILEQPHVESLATQLKESLQQAQNGPSSRSVEVSSPQSRDTV